MNELGSRIAKIRKYKNLNIRSFSKYLNISAGYLSEIERNIKIPGGLIFLHIKNSFPEINMNWLFSGEDSMIIKQNILSKTTSSPSLSHQIKTVQSRITPEIIRNIKPLTCQSGETIAFVLCSPAIPEILKAALECLGEQK